MIITKCLALPLYLHNLSALKSFYVGLKLTFRQKVTIIFVIRSRCLRATQAAISRSPSTTPLREAESTCPQKWVVVLFPRLGQFPPVRASVRLGEARRKRMQLTMQLESEF